MNMRENLCSVSKPEVRSVAERVQRAIALLEQGCSVKDIAQAFKLPTRWANRYMRLAENLDVTVLDFLDDKRKCVTPPPWERGKISFRMAELIALLPKRKQLEVVQTAIGHGLSYEEVQTFVEEGSVARLSIESKQTPEAKRLLQDIDACIAQVNMLRCIQGLDTETTNALMKKAHRLQEMISGMEVSNNLGKKVDPNRIFQVRPWKARATPQELLQWFAPFAR